MGKNGKLLNLNSDSPKYGNKSLVTKEQENELKRRKITFSFSYFKQIPNFQIGECSKGWHIGLLERLGVGKSSVSCPLKPSDSAPLC